MIRLRSAEKHAKTEEKKQEVAEAITAIRKHYPHSVKEYTAAQLSNVCLIIVSNDIYGYCEVTFKNLDIEAPSEVILYVHELHIAPSRQKNGVGKRVLDHLLDLHLPLEMVIASENENMLRLLKKYDFYKKFSNENTATYVVRRA